MKTQIIGEIGINHNGSLKTALRLIKECKEIGVSVVKFQKRTPEICVPENQKNIIRETPWGKITYLEYKKKIEFEKKEFDIIDRYCKKIGIKWTASVWDIPSFHFINQYNVPFIKIPSALITDGELLEEIKIFAKCPIIISIGMSTMDEVFQAVYCLSEKLYGILHCNSTYPCEQGEIDLNVIHTLKKEFPHVKVGYSGHEQDLLPSTLAAAIGAEVIERHVTLSKDMWGTDQKASLEISELKQLIKNIRDVEVIMGKSTLTVYPGEYVAMEKLRNRSNFLDKYSKTQEQPWLIHQQDKN